MPESRFAPHNVARFYPVYKHIAGNQQLPAVFVPAVMGLNPQTFISRVRDGKKAIEDGSVTLQDLDKEKLITNWPLYQFKEVNNQVDLLRRGNQTIEAETQMLTVDQPTSAELEALCLLRATGRLPAPIKLTRIQHDYATVADAYDTIIQPQPDGSYLLF